MNMMVIVFLVLAVCTLLLSSCELNQQNEQISSSVAEISNTQPVNDAPSDVDSTINTESAESSMQKQGTINIVALGDSIPRGYGLENPFKENFPSQIATSFRALYEDVNMMNYAVDGLTSSELLEQLQSGVDAEVVNADVVIVCIGGNNILKYAYELINQNNTDIIELFNAYVAFITGDKSDIAAPEELDAYFNSINEYAKNSVFLEKVNTGVALLQSDIPKIAAEIKHINQDATIYFTTIYNPYKNMKITLPYVQTTLHFDEISDTAVCMLNDVISGLAQQNEYNIVDIYTLFQNSNKKIVNAGLDLENMTVNFDPHPNVTGHSLIAEEFFKLITEDFA